MKPPIQLLREAAQLDAKQRPAEALACLEEILAAEPSHLPALTAAARICGRQRDFARARTYLERATAAAPDNWQLRLDLCMLLVSQQAFAEAEPMAAQLAAEQPKNSAILNLHGVALRRLGRPDEALAAFSAAMRADRRNFSPYVNAGGVHMDREQYEQALELLNQAARMAPKDADVIRNLGLAQNRKGDYVAALTSARRAILLNPKFADAHADMAAVCFNLQKFDDALEAAGRAVALRRVPSMLILQARILRKLGRVDEAIVILRDILAQAPDHAEANAALGSLYLGEKGDNRAAIECLRRAMASAPNDGAAMGQLLYATLNFREGDEAENIEEAYRLACAWVDQGKPMTETAYAIQGVLLRTADFERLNRLGPASQYFDGWARRNNIGALHNQLGRVKTMDDRLRLVAAHRHWGALQEAKVARVNINRQPHAAGAKIRIGFMSSDLRDHPVGHFALPIFRYYDRDRFELRCYSFYPRPADKMQQWIAGQVAEYHVMSGQSDQNVARRIADDGLDILFELGGSTQFNRLEIMAYRPAPVQASWLGYPHSAGLSTIDYILVDPYLKPERPDLLIEKPFVMPHSWVTLDSTGFPDEAIDPELPETRAGHLTFGTLNSPYKFTAETIGLWAAIMRQVPNSHFMFVRPEGGVSSFRRNFAAAFARHGISADRLDFIGQRGRHLPFYNRIDIALDPAPHTGGTTTCESMWMGVPVVTLVGDAFFERISFSNVTNAGLGDLCARTPEAYVAAALALVADRPRRLELRRGLRDQLRRSPLGQQQAWVRDFQAQVEMVI